MCEAWRQSLRFAELNSIVAVCFSRKMSLMSYFSHKRHHNASQVSSALKLKAATRRVMAHYVRSSYTLLDIPVTEGYCMAALDTHVGDNKRPVIMLMHLIFQCRV